MTEERDPDAETETPTEFLEGWREAERDAAKAEPGSAAEQMARMRADAARDQFHDAEDEEREHQGNHRPRKHDS